MEQLIKIDGMTCGGCVKSIEKALQNIEGINAVEISLENAQAQINYEANIIETAAIITAIEDAGFDAQVI